MLVSVTPRDANERLRASQPRGDGPLNVLGMFGLRIIEHICLREGKDDRGGGRRERFDLINEAIYKHDHETILASSHLKEPSSKVDKIGEEVG